MILNVRAKVVKKKKLELPLWRHRHMKKKMKRQNLIRKKKSVVYDNYVRAITLDIVPIFYPYTFMNTYTPLN